MNKNLIIFISILLSISISIIICLTKNDSNSTIKEVKNSKSNIERWKQYNQEKRSK